MVWVETSANKSYYDTSDGFHRYHKTCRFLEIDSGINEKRREDPDLALLCLWIAKTRR